MTVARSSQIAIVSVGDFPPPPIDITQLAIVSVVANNSYVLSLQTLFPLPCWQPCTAYGTRSIVVNIGRN